jgi:hypothetical protein
MISPYKKIHHRGAEYTEKRRIRKERKEDNSIWEQEPFSNTRTPNLVNYKVSFQIPLRNIGAVNSKIYFLSSL